jgi:hypothetical protein
MAVTEIEFNSIVAFTRTCTDMSVNPTYAEWKSITKKNTKNSNTEIATLFENFWKEYPSTSSFTYNGINFKGNRTLRSNKSVCYAVYHDCVMDIIANNKEKNLSLQAAASALLNALQVQLNSMKESSYKEGNNRLEYMKQCERYLRHKEYEAWLWAVDNTSEIQEIFSL